MTQEGLDGRLPFLYPIVQQTVRAPQTLKRRLMGIIPSWQEKGFGEDVKNMQAVGREIAGALGLNNLEQDLFGESFGRHVEYHALYGLQKSENDLNPTQGSRVRRKIGQMYTMVGQRLSELHHELGDSIAKFYPVTEQQVTSWLEQVDAAASHVALLFDPNTHQSIPNAAQIDEKLERVREARGFLRLSDEQMSQIDRTYMISKAMKSNDIAQLSRLLGITEVQVKQILSLHTGNNSSRRKP